MTPAALIRSTLALVALAAACSESTGPVGDVTAWKSSAGILLSNMSSKPIYSMAAERGMIPLLDWYPCTSASSPACQPTARPGAAVTIPWERVGGAVGPRGDYVLYWWQSIPDPRGGTTWDSMRVISPVP